MSFKIGDKIMVKKMLVSDLNLKFYKNYSYKDFIGKIGEIKRIMGKIYLDDSEIFNIYISFPFIEDGDTLSFNHSEIKLYNLNKRLNN